MCDVCRWTECGDCGTDILVIYAGNLCHGDDSNAAIRKVSKLSITKFNYIVLHALNKSSMLLFRSIATLCTGFQIY